MNDIIIVSSHYNEEISWIEKCNIDYLVVSKSKKNPKVKNFVKIKNIGPEEFRSYIYYILNYWDNLPEKIGFIHGHENSYHQQFSMSEILKKLKHIKTEKDFLNLNGDIKNPSNSKSCAMHSFHKPHPMLPHFFKMWQHLGLEKIMKPPDFACIPPSAQCLVKSKKIKSFGKEFWEHIFNVLTNEKNYYSFSLVMEIAWPLIFGIDPDNNDYFVRQFYDYFRKNDLCFLVANPKNIYPDSKMRLLELINSPISKKDWVFNLMSAIQQANNLKHSSFEDKGEVLLP